MSSQIMSLALAALMATATATQTKSIFTFMEDYHFDYSSPPYTQVTVHGSRLECSAVCLHEDCAGLRYDGASGLCTIYPSFDRVIAGAANMYMRDGKLVEMLATFSYSKLGHRYFNITLQKDLTYDQAVETCSSVFGFGTLFVPKSSSEAQQAAALASAKDLKDDELWLGLDDVTTERTLKWADGTSYTSLLAPDMIWEKDDDQKDNNDDKDCVNVKLKEDKGDLWWEAKFKDNSHKAEGALCEVDIYFN